MTDDVVLLGHGSGGRQSHRLIRETIGRILSNKVLPAYDDAALLSVEGAWLAFTTDTYVVNPVEFPGGDIGSLAVSGTVNDIAVMGAVPRAISCALVIEEGFNLRLLEELLESMRRTADDAEVEIATGDTKVVGRGDADGIFINTSGIGWFLDPSPLLDEPIAPGDVVLVNGTIGDHGAAVMAAREGLETDLRSDCAPLADIIGGVLLACPGVKFMRDATRGGVATVLNELAEGQDYGIRLDEAAVPVSDPVRAFCDTLGFDPFYVANEGKAVFVVRADHADAAFDALCSHPLGADAARIGVVTDESAGLVVADTAIGGSRIVDMLSGEQLPRIC